MSNLDGFIIICYLHDVGVVAVPKIGRKFRLSAHRKNEERKKYTPANLTVSIPLKNVCVRIQSLSFNVSFLYVYANAPVPRIHSLKYCLEIAHALPQGTFAFSHPISLATCLYPLMFNDAGWSATVDKGHTGVERTSLTLFNLRCHSS